jgi:predicted 3-demethylubiquinone-9 3-methyltransferase (glyoxalase superfamily)
MISSQRITPSLWFDGQAAEAMKLYTSLFPNSAILNQQHWPEGSSFSSDWVMAGTFVIDGLKVMVMDAGPMFKFNESCSFVVLCKNQEEINRYWYALTADGGQESQCGWLKDKFGLSWQIVPESINAWVSSGDSEKLSKMFQSLYTMKKLIIADLEAAYNG